jgi:hypothetical protein
LLRLLRLLLPAVAMRSPQGVLQRLWLLQADLLVLLHLGLLVLRSLSPGRRSIDVE